MGLARQMNAVPLDRTVGDTEQVASSTRGRLMPSAGEPGREPQKGEQDCGAAGVREGLEKSTWTDGGVVSGAVELKPLVPGPDSGQTVCACPGPASENCVE